MFRTHVAFAILVGLLSLQYVNIGGAYMNPYIYFGAIIIAAMIPDIDLSDSYIGRKNKLISVWIEFFFGHRGIFHSVYPLILIYVLFFLVFKLNVLGFALIIGYGSHLVTDMLNKKGVYFFPPFEKTRFSGWVKTGSFFEYMLFIVLVIVDIIVMGWYV